MRTIAIIGLGLIGGSIARQLHHIGNFSIAGYSHSRIDGQAALDAGVIDYLADSLSDAVRDADLAVIAVSPEAIPVIAEQIGQLNAHILITDTGSTKLPLVRAMDSMPQELASRFIPAHPVAGNQFSGFVGSDKNLFVDKTIVLTPAQANEEQGIKRVEGFWRLFTPKVVRIEAALHDVIFAYSSHLPHMVAWALTLAVSSNEKAALIFEYSAGGLKDFTRIAASDPELWAEIALSNRNNIIEAMDAFMGQFQQLRSCIDKCDQTALLHFLEGGRTAHIGAQEAVAWRRSK
ncbi:MAG: prephenate dehydrogenase [Gammaproteobacteria bacterium]